MKAYRRRRVVVRLPRSQRNGNWLGCLFLGFYGFFIYLCQRHSGPHPSAHPTHVDQLFPKQPMSMFRALQHLQPTVNIVAASVSEQDGDDDEPPSTLQVSIIITRKACHLDVE